ncbi:hypothetical protein PPACK8108_LOCUS16544 [Phakopsora pachyrhizi]|uniref:Uncharacterized protein n=1 Tax=Phakopsora pachyrhizi TaxID=170000 RepID=A0AAV0B7Q5_PHAPC|nr:hypothetical protein PPACK8108_LOCUS16544 [Phakopsora pachyrhizi]
MPIEETPASKTLSVISFLNEKSKSSLMLLIGVESFWSMLERVGISRSDWAWMLLPAKSSLKRSLVEVLVTDRLRSVVNPIPGIRLELDDRRSPLIPGRLYQSKDQMRKHHDDDDDHQINFRSSICPIRSAVQKKLIQKP